jgi:hypothetical protein
MRLVDAVEENLGLDGIVKVLKDESSPCLGVAFRHYQGTKSWKSGSSAPPLPPPPNHKKKSSLPKKEVIELPRQEAIND